MSSNELDASECDTSILEISEGNKRWYKIALLAISLRLASTFLLLLLVVLYRHWKRNTS